MKNREENMNNLGKRIKFLRRNKKMTQKELGILLGFSEKTACVRIAQYENYNRVPREIILKKICQIFDIKKEILLSDTNDDLINLCIDMYWMCMEGIASFLIFNFYKRVNDYFPEKYKIFVDLIN